MRVCEMDSVLWMCLLTEIFVTGEKRRVFPESGLIIILI